MTTNERRQPDHAFEHEIKLFAWILAALMALLCLTVGAYVLPLGPLETIAGLSIAVLKAALIVWFFMEVRLDTPLARLFAAAGLIWLAILFMLTLTDYFTRAPLI